MKDSVAGQKQSSNRQESPDSDKEGYDEEGNPLTVTAAQKKFHNNQNALYVKGKRLFRNKREARSQLQHSKITIKKLMDQAKLQQFNMIGEQLSVAIETDKQVADMPRIRVTHRHNRNQILSQTRFGEGLHA